MVVAALAIPALGPSAAPAAPSGLGGWTAHAGLVRLDWDDVPDATGYQLGVWTGDHWRTLPGEGIDVRLNGSSAFVGGVAADRPYRFSVRAVSSSAVSAWSNGLLVPAAAAAIVTAGDASAATPGAVRVNVPASPRVSRERPESVPPSPATTHDPDPLPAPVERPAGATCATATDLGDITDAIGSRGSANPLPGKARRARAFSFDLTSTRWVEIGLGELEADADLYLYGGLGRRLAASQNPGADAELLSRALRPGTHCLHVVSVEAGGGNFQLTYEAAIPSGEPAAELAAWQQALDLGDIADQSGTTDSTGILEGGAGSVEYFRFEISRPQRLEIAIAGLGAGVTMALEDSDGGIIATSSVPGSERPELSATLLEGVYFVRVQASAGAPGGYRLSHAATPAGADDVKALRAELASRVQGSFAEIESLRLPDLVSDPPTQPGATSVVITPEGTVLLALRFEGYVTNLGTGPLHLGGNPQLADPADATSHNVWQHVIGESGDLVKFAKPPVRFETSDGHNHFHLMEIVAYSLWDTTGKVQVRHGEKVGFCLLDAEKLSERHPRPGQQRYSEAGIEDCMANRPGATSLLMGVTEGWRDIYEQDVVFQWVDVSDVTPGRYRIGVEADPYDIVAESDEANNGVALSNRVSLVPGFVAKPQVVRANPGEPAGIELDQLQFGDPGRPGYRIVTQPSNGALQTAGNFTLFGGGGTAHPAFFTNRVTYTPDPGFVGVDRFTFAAFDSWSPQYPANPAVATVTIDLSGLDATVAIDNAPGSLAAGESIDLAALVTGAGDAVQWTVRESSGIAELAGTIDAAGRYTAPILAPPGGTVTIRAASQQSPSAFVEVKLAITFASNTPPAVAAPSAQTFAVGDSLDVAVLASDAQGDTLTWSVDELPAGLEIVASTGRIVGNPTRAGSLTSSITVSDGQLATTVSIGWTIV